MTFKELQEKIGTQNKSDWHQHENGGGWVQNSCTVSEDSYIGVDAIVYNNSRVYNSRVDNSSVYNSSVYNSRVYNSRVDNSSVDNNSRVDNSSVYNSSVYNSSVDNVTSNGATVNGVWKDTAILFIVGSKHTLSNSKPGHIQIGCHCKPIKWWQENYKDIGKKERYTDAEIEEYGLYIELFAKVGK